MCDLYITCISKLFLHNILDNIAQLCFATWNNKQTNINENIIVIQLLKTLQREKCTNPVNSTTYFEGDFDRLQ